MMAHAALVSEQQGFVGAVSGMSLADIIQVKGANRYSGCLVVEHLGKNGVIYFREGEVVHAEQGALAGEEAFYAIMGWVGGTFRSEPKVATTNQTINQSLSFLILEALRRFDEANNVQQQTRQQAQQTQSTDSVSPIASRKGEGVSDIQRKLSGIPGIEQALIMTKDGVVADETSYESQFIGAHGLFLALFAGQLGSSFGLGSFKSATVEGNDHHLILFESKSHHLCVSAKGSGNVNALDAEIRRVLVQK